MNQGARAGDLAARVDQLWGGFKRGLGGLGVGRGVGRGTFGVGCWGGVGGLGG